jgi:hypothetical protein
MNSLSHSTFRSGGTDLPEILVATAVNVFEKLVLDRLLAAALRSLVPEPQATTPQRRGAAAD